MKLLYDHQRQVAIRGLRILSAYGILYLAMQVRTGKTLTALTVAWMYRSRKILFITKKGAMMSVQKDMVMLQDWIKSNQIKSHDFDVKIVNFESLHKIPGSYTPDLIIVDEAHSTGTYPKPSLRAKQIRSIVGDRPVIIMSGTPSPESYSQLFHQFWLSSRSPWRRFKNFYAWAKEYVQIKVKYYSATPSNDYSNAKREKIYADISKYIITLSQKEAGITQNVDENILLVDPPEGLDAIMETLKKDKMVAIDGNDVLGDTGAKLMSKIHQLSGGTYIDESGEQHILSTFKAEYIKEKFDGQHIAIFYKFQAEGDVLKSVFKKWTDDPELFHDNRSYTFIRQVVSGREGISLRSADALVMYAIDFSALSYFQSRSRIQDVRRQKPALLFWIFTSTKLDFENKVYKVVSSKKDYTLRYFKHDFNIE